MAKLRVLVLGGYGNFGKIIVQHLSEILGIQIIIAGRNLQKAEIFAAQFHAQAVALDSNQPDLAQRLRALNIQLIISTAGPFQKQDYRVATAAIEAGVHYIDLADGRDFVCGIGVLDQKAKEHDVLVCSGASSVPGLSSAVVRELSSYFSVLEKIEMAISTSEKIPGKSTIEGMLGYCGKPIKQLIDGDWKTVHGWQNLYSYKFSKPIGRRLLAVCDIPDLTLFPEHYNTLKTVTFSAGTGLKITHLGTWFFSWLIRWGVIRKPQKFAGIMHRYSLLLERFGNGLSAMYIVLTGLDHNQHPVKLCWELVASDNDGVNIPCLSSVALTRKLLAGQLTQRGAMSSMGLLTLDEYLAELAGLNIQTRVYELDKA